MTDRELESLVALAGHRRKLQLTLRQMRGEVVAFDRLVLVRQPVPRVKEGKRLAPFEVHANPGIDSEVCARRSCIGYGPNWVKIIPELKPCECEFGSVFTGGLRVVRSRPRTLSWRVCLVDWGSYIHDHRSKNALPADTTPLSLSTRARHVA